MYRKKIREAIKKEFLLELRDRVETQGLLGRESEVDVSMEKINSSGLGDTFVLLDIVKEDIEKCFKGE